MISLLFLCLGTAFGHNWMVYFVLIHKNDSAKLSQNSIKATGSVEDYIAKAPAQLLDYTASPMVCANCKYHRTGRGENATHALGGTVKSHYAQPGAITAGPYYRARPVEFGSARSQYAYIASPDDRYVSYKSADYPWMLSVWRYAIQESDAGEWDFSVFHIPTQYGAGDYIIHYLWSGYYDCIDINVLDPAKVDPALLSGGLVPYPYGKTPAGRSLTANRVDHCVFDEPLSYVTFPQPFVNTPGAPMANAISSCVKNCIDSYEQGACAGISAFPLSLLNKNWGSHWNISNNTIKTFYETAWSINKYWSGAGSSRFDRNYYVPNDPTARLDVNNNTIYSGIWRRYAYGTDGIYRWVGVNQTTLDYLKNYLETGTGEADPWVCVYVNPRLPTSTVDKYTLSDDPLDPVFYMTCYEILEQKEFIGFNSTMAATSFDIPYRFQTSGTSGCISCADQVGWTERDYTPRWTMASTCRLCEREPVPVLAKSAYPRSLLLRSNIGVTVPATDTSCTTYPNDNPRAPFTSWQEYCLIPLTYTHPLLDSSADYNTDKYWTGPITGIGESSIVSRLGYQSTRLRENFQSSLQLCNMRVSRDSRCSNVFDYRVDDRTLGCRCVRENPCCLNYFWSSTATSNFTRMIVESKPPKAGTPFAELDPLCNRNITGLKSAANPTLCCKVPATQRTACGSAGCAAVSGGSSPAGAMCRGYQIPPDRCCKDFAPPCVVCP